MERTTHTQRIHGLRAAALRPLARILPLIILAACGTAGHRGSAEAPISPSQEVELVLLGTTDVHGWVWAHDYYTGEATGNGLALIKPLVDSVRAENPGRTYLFDSGDLIQGNPLAAVYARQAADEPNPIITGMNLLGYDAGAIGNHEFNYGLEHFARAIEQADYPFASANVFRHGTDEHAYTPYTLIPHVVAEGDTILIGVTGNTPPGVHVWDRHHVEGVLEFRDIVASLHPVVKEMRERGADLVVLLSHGGFEGTSYDTAGTGLTAENVSARVAREVPGIDVVFLGHTHRELADSTIVSEANPEGVLFTQPKNWATSMSVATVRMTRVAPNEWRVTRKRAELLRPDPARADTAFMDALREPHERTVAWVNSVIGHSPVRWEATRSRVEDTPILDFINEVQRQAAGTDLSATAAFNLRAAIPEGEVTVADLAGLYVYDNTLKAVRITGAQLRAYLEKSAEYFHTWTGDGRPVVNREVPGYNFDVVSGVDYTIDLTRPVGERITELTWRGEPVRDDQTFTIALNNYRQGGGGGFTMLANAPVIHDEQQDIRDLLIEEVRRRGTLRPEDYFRRNWKIVPAEAAAQALEEMRGGW